ncbi:MAG TPA: hydantoinase/oxoprolinase N-terminal domain-containing protein, partial [Pirellulaceae bacterium]|nr:hydantoinase/oxoprolinase N-terminal domain-containing protein [Pirellulaceae bacterium]
MHSFWVDVGGTFTDCVMRAPDGRLRRHKLLSSGATKGSVAAGSTREQILDAARTIDPRDFWAGCELRLLDAGGQVAATRRVTAFERDGGALNLDRPLDDVSAAGQAYELRTGLEAPLVGIRWMLGLAPSDSLPPVAVRLGTTRGTNALLTRRGARTAFVTTRGFGDILHIGYQNRPRIFDLDIRKPTPLFSAVVEVDERVTPDGAVLRPLDELDAR